MMETKVKIMERAEQGEKMVDIACSYNTELLAVHTRSLLMKTWWNWRPRERMEKQEEEVVTEELKRFMSQRMAREFSLF